VWLSEPGSLKKAGSELPLEAQTTSFAGNYAKKESFCQRLL
jgi:hypothetical protein